jgi:FkbM family methyltransferase
MSTRRMPVAPSVYRLSEHGMSWTGTLIRSALLRFAPVRRLVDQKNDLRRGQLDLAARLDDLQHQIVHLAQEIDACHADLLRVSDQERRLAVVETLGAVTRNVDLMRCEDLFFLVFEGDLPHRVTPEELRGQHSKLSPTELEAAVRNAREAERGKDLDAHDPVARAVVSLSANGPVHLLYVGVNYGFHVLKLADFIAKRHLPCRVHAFDPGLAGRLFPANVRLNRLSDIVSFHDIAVSGSNGYAILQEVPGHSEDNKIVNMVVSPLRRSRAVETTTIDEFARIHGLSGQTVIVVDTQGSEPDILDGASGYLTANPCVLVVEFTPWAIGARLLAQDFLRLLLRRGRVFDIGPGENLGQSAGGPGRMMIRDAVTDATADAFAARIFETEPNWTDLLVLPCAEPWASRLIRDFPLPGGKATPNGTDIASDGG